MNIVPFYPLRVLPSEDYFGNYLIYSFGRGEATDRVKYFSSPRELLRSIPEREPLFCHTMNMEMVAFYCMLICNRRLKKRFKELVPHTSFGKYHPWGFRCDMFSVLKPIMARFDKIRALTPYEYGYFQKRGLKQTYYLPLFVDKKFFGELSTWPTGEGVLAMGGSREVKNLKTILKACAISGHKLTVLDNVMPGSKEYVQAFKDSSVFANSSYQEGFSLGSAEAYAANMKLCLSDIPTLKSQYRERALYHEPDDYEQLAKNINYCFSA